MSPPPPPNSGALAEVVAAIDPALQLKGSRPLAGGVSAQVTAIEAELAGSGAQRLVVQQYGPANLLSDPHSAAHEYLLHGDYWPGNVLWRHGAITGVIDWEDAAFGNPLADVCLTRMELCMAFGAAAMRELTRAYRDLMPSLDVTALPHWDLFAALRHAGRMSGWGLAATDLARLRAGHRAFVAMALAQVAEPGRRRPPS